MSDALPDSIAAPDELENRVVLVTGAGDGIGRAVSLAAAAHGATVVLLGRTTRKLETVYDQIIDAGGPKPGIYPMNLEGAVMKDYEELAATIEREFGRLDGLVHNAGILGSKSPIEHYDPMDWHRVMHVNLSAPFLLTRVCLPLLRKAPDASIVFVSSSVGRRGRAYWGAYAVSKFGLEGLMQVLADETEDSQAMRCNSLNPGATRTGMRRQAYPGEDPATLKTPDAVVEPFLYLLGPRSRGVTGKAFDAG